MFTVKEVAIQLRLSSRAVYRAVEQGELEHHRFGTQIRISKSQLEAFIEKSLVTVRAGPPADEELIRRHLES
jgi:excisionase family DNA binding protein